MYRVLLVDNDPAARAHVAKSHAWEENRFRVQAQAASAGEALGLYRAHPYDMMVTDIQMPGADGFSLLEQVSKMERETMVVLLSDTREFSAVRRGLRLGAFDYLDKPVEQAALSQMLTRARDHMDRKHRKGQLPIVAEQKQPLLSALREEHYCDRAAAEAFRQFNRFSGGEPEQLARLAEQLLVQIFDELCGCHPWLPRFESFSPSLRPGRPPQKIQRQFDLHMEFLRRLVQKYGLYYEGGLADLASRYLAERLEQSPTMDEVAEALRLNKDYFGKLFSRKTGMTFKRFSVVLKMEYAKELMGSGNYTNCELAQMLGYGTTDHFVKLFKEHAGVTPAQYKNGARLNETSIAYHSENEKE